MTARLRAGVLRALAALGADALGGVHDASLTPVKVVRALDGAAPVVLRVGVPLVASTEAHGPAPRDPVWLRLEDSPALVVAPLVGGETKALSARAVALVRHEDHCCDAARCERLRASFEVALLCDHADGDTRLTVHEGGDSGLARAVAVALARRVRVPVEGARVEDVAVDGAPHEPAGDVELAGFEGDTSESLSAHELAAYVLRCEAGRWVLRNRGSAGPRAALGRELLLLGALVSAALGGGVLASLAWHAGQRERAAIAGVCGVVAAIASYAVVHIALHSARYEADGEPILVVHRDRLVPSPWVSRRGEIALAPEGRYGAALALGGVTGLSIEADGEAHRLVLESDHGPYELARFGSELLAQRWRRVLLEVFAWSRHVAMLVLFGAIAWASSACGSAPPSSAPFVRGPETAPSASSASEVSSATASGPRATSASAAPVASSAPPARVNAATSSESVAPATPPTPPTIDDDVPAALAAGRARGAPVLVDVWAAWCHTCLSMKAYVLPDPRVAALASEVVFATVDGENERNAAFLGKHRPGVWPTFFVLDPRDGAVLGAWEGSASAEELVRFVRGSLDARGRQPDPAVAALLAGARAAAAGRCGEAIGAFARALALGGDGFARRGEAVKGLLYCQRREGRHAACVETGLLEVPRADGASVPADLAGTLLDCADKLSDPGARARAYDVAIERLRREVASPSAGASVDDRSDALAQLAVALRARGEAPEAEALLDRQRALLEQAAARAGSPEARAAFDYARMNLYLAAREGERAVALLQERALEMPSAYEPRARLAQALASLGRDEEALHAIEQALALVKGPRRLRYLSLQADLLARLGRREREREVVAAIVAAYEAQPPTQRRHPANVSGLTEARKRLRRLR